MLDRSERTGSGWQTPIVPTVATDGRGVEDLAAAVLSHRDHLRRSGEGERRERERAERDLEERLRARLFERWHVAGAARLADAAEKVARRECSPEEAVKNLLNDDPSPAPLQNACP
jgi:LAO/AO transport system kinase